MKHRRFQARELLLVRCICGTMPHSASLCFKKKRDAQDLLADADAVAAAMTTTRTMLLLFAAT
jgi:hypothetical protein